MTDMKAVSSNIELITTTKSDSHDHIKEDHVEGSNTNQSENSAHFAVPVQLKASSQSSSKSSASLSSTHLQYVEPEWALCVTLSESHYSLDVLKSGIIIENISLSSDALANRIKQPRQSSYLVIGKLPICDLQLEHPSISRFHAVLQFGDDTTTKNPSAESTRAPGWYLYDLGSSHGSFINKSQLPARTFVRLRVGDFIRFAGSTRQYLLNGPDEDRPPEMEATVSELLANKSQHAASKVKSLPLETLESGESDGPKREGDGGPSEKKDSAAGISWGMGLLEPDEEANAGDLPQVAVCRFEHLYIDEPKKFLKKWFERELGEPPRYEFLEAPPGKSHVIIEHVIHIYIYSYSYTYYGVFKVIRVYFKNMTSASDRSPFAKSTSFLCRAQLSSSPSSRTGCLSMKSAARRLASALRLRASVAALARVTCAPTTTTRTRALGAESVARRALLAASAAFVQRCSRPAGSARRCASALSKRAVCSTNSANSTRTAPRRVRNAYASPRLLLPQNARVSSNSDLLRYTRTADIPQRLQLHNVCTRTRTT